MKRRTFIQATGVVVAASSMGAPAILQAAGENKLVYVPPSGLLILDPHFTTINQTTYYGHWVYDTLYAIDSKWRARPQMAAGHTVSDDGLTWKIKLRDGLKFHDGEPVRAQDCVASINRWGQRDSFGATLLNYTNELIAIDDTTIQFQLNRPFGVLPDALAHPVASPCVIMPERIAATPISEQVTESIGSGPLKFRADEFVPGEFAAFERNTDYLPRDEIPDGMSGGKVINFDRFEWKTLSDQATATAAIQAGEVDWVNTVHQDLVDLLKSDPNLQVETSDTGYRNWIRFNCGTEPFNNVELRRTVAASIDQTMFTQALLGKNAGPECLSIYQCGLPGVNELGADLMGGPKDFDALAARVKASGYNGEKVVMIIASDLPTVAPMGPLLVDTLQKIGINIEMQSMDLNTFVSRRASNDAAEDGGWSMFPFLTSTPVMVNPLSAVVARGLGAKGYPGNYEDAVLEADIENWIASNEGSERDAALETVHARLWTAPPVYLALESIVS